MNDTQYANIKKEVEGGKPFGEVIHGFPQKTSKPIIKAVAYGAPIEVIPKEKKERPAKHQVPYFCQKDMLAILGTAESLPAAPFEDKNFEIWGPAVVTTHKECRRVDLLFELHTQGYWKDANVLKRMNATKLPIYMHEKYQEVPLSMRYPIEIITESYRQYHTNSISYILALAYHSFIEMGKPKHVAMFGVHMQAREEYSEQRPCCEYWIGRMEGAGMNVEPSPDGAVLVSMGLYGYENYHPVCWDLRQRIAALHGGVGKADQELKKWTIQKARQEGAIIESEYWLRRFQKGEVSKGDTS